MANYSGLCSTFINLYYNPEIFKTFSKIKLIFIVFYLLLCCLLSVLWLCENMILNDLRFDFHGHFENQISNQIPIFQCDFKKSQNRPKII
jgi:hypothetical protein